MTLTEKKDEVHFALAKMIYTNELTQPKVEYKDWSLDKALAEVQLALAIDSIPFYSQLEGDLYFIQRSFDKAAESYARVNASNLATAPTYFTEARALEMSGGDVNEIVTLIDKAVNTYAKPYPQEAALYIWERAKAYYAAEKPRDAVVDFNEYSRLMNGQVNDLFYYHRSQAALAARMNQLAIDDIAQAVTLSPENPIYLAEQASILLRFNLIDEAIVACQKALELDPEFADCYRILGYCQVQKGDKEAGCANFHKAKELGDELADGLIEKFCK